MFKLTKSKDKQDHLEILDFANEQDDETQTYIKYLLARNNYLDLEIQLILAKDEDKNIRATLAINSNLTEVQKILANDENEFVRFALAGSMFINDEIVKILKEDNSNKVKTYANWLRRHFFQK